MQNSSRASVSRPTPTAASSLFASPNAPTQAAARMGSGSARGASGAEP